MNKRDKRAIREAVASIPNGTVFTAVDIADMFGNRSPTHRAIGSYLRSLDDLVIREPTKVHKNRPWRRL